MSAALYGIAPKAKVVGSKLVLDAHRLFDYRRKDELLRAIEHDITLIHLKRNYFDVLLSLEARGSVNILTEEGMKNSDNSAILNKDNWNRSAEIYNTKKSTSELIIKLLIFFSNDLLCRTLLSATNRSFTIPYGNISSDFCELARFVGSEAPEEELQKTINRPKVAKLPPIPPERLPNHWSLREIAARLDGALDEVSEGKSCFEEIFSVQTLELRVRGLADLVNDAVGHRLGMRKCMMRMIRKSAANEIRGFKRLRWRLFERI